MKRLLPIFVSTILVAVCLIASAQQDVKDKAWQISTPPGWTRPPHRKGLGEKRIQKEGAGAVGEECVHKEVKKSVNS